jgi:hypothetical protein
MLVTFFTWKRLKRRPQLNYKDFWHKLCPVPGKFYKLVTSVSIFHQTTNFFRQCVNASIYKTSDILVQTQQAKKVQLLLWMWIPTSTPDSHMQFVSNRQRKRERAQRFRQQCDQYLCIICKLYVTYRSHNKIITPRSSSSCEAKSH